MKIKTRWSSSGFLELKTDQQETTVFKKDVHEINEIINNLISVIEDLASIKNQSVTITFEEN